MRICVIFNPTAKGEKARRLRRHLDSIASECALKQTVAAGGARSLATEAIAEGFDTIVAAGGDGTMNEVLNGIGDAPDGFARARLALLPIGTVNVFAKDLGLPIALGRSWEVIRAGRESKIDLPLVEYDFRGKRQKRYFAQLAGAGLDARAIELVNWPLKKKIGPLAYIWAGFMALRQPASQITATAGENSATGELVLLGNGRYYGGKFPVFPRADPRDGLLDVSVFPRTNLRTLFRCAGMFIARRDLPAGAARMFRAEMLTLQSSTPTPLEVDGEGIGHLPATFSIQRQRLRVLVP